MMCESIRRGCCSLVLAVCLVFMLGEVRSADQIHVPGANGGDFIVFDVYDQGESLPEDYNYPNSQSESEWTISPAVRDALVSAGGYWASLLSGNSKQDEALRIVVYGQNNHPNVGGFSSLLDSGNTAFAESVINGDMNPSSAGYIVVGDWGKSNSEDVYDTAPISVLPQNSDKLNASSTFLHEIMHAAGVGALVNSNGALSEWGQHLYDSWNRPITVVGGSGINVVKPEENPGNTDFVLDSLNRATFKGDKVVEVVGDRWVGVAQVGGWEDGTPDLGHINIPNILMSHLDYRNYGVLTELELAVLQDLGYAIDRRNHFGASIYGDNGSYNSSEGYFARNAAGTGYITDEYNDTAFGMGLHVYGSGNYVFQRHNILSSGYGGVGVRVDGSENYFENRPGNKIAADGASGTGVMVSYGSGNVINNYGHISANGSGGIGMRFDYGGNMMGNTTEYRGSFIQGKYDENGKWTSSTELLPELRNPGVNEVNLLGGSSLAGKEAAIYISDNFYVPQIHVYNGATITGDIISHWNPKAEEIHQSIKDLNLQLKTDLSFGMKFNAGGLVPDPDFLMRYVGNINYIVDPAGMNAYRTPGSTSMNLSLHGGRLAIDGKVGVADVNLVSGTMLGGNGSYWVDSAGRFYNAGQLSPGNSLGTITIEGKYVQADTGSMFLELDNAGNNDRLEITGGLTNLADIEGTVQFAPLAAYYRNGETVTIDIDDFVAVDNYTSLQLVQGSSAFAAPELVAGDGQIITFSLIDVDEFDGEFTWGVTRSASGYAQAVAGSGYGNGDMLSVANALDNIALGAVTGPLTDVLAALDFTKGADTLARGIDSLSPKLYGTSARASLDAQNQMSSALFSRLFGQSSAGFAEAAASGVRMFATPFGGYSRQRGRSSVEGYTGMNAGTMVGIEKYSDGSVFGAHLAYQYQKLDGEDADRFSGNGFYAGVHGLAAPRHWNGGYLFGAARVGVEDSRLDRDVRIGNAMWRTEGEWNSVTLASTLGAGYDFAVNASTTVGPMAQVDYAGVFRPSIDEGRSSAPAVVVESEGYHSFRSGLGLKLRSRIGSASHIEGSARWNHEFLESVGSTRAAFSGYGSQSFRASNKNAGRDSLAVQAGVRTEVRDNVSLSASVGGEFFRSGWSNIWGEAGVSVSF